MFGQGGLNFLWSHRRCESRENLPFLADQELGEIPGDVLVAIFIGVSCFQESVKVARPVAVHLDLGEHGEGHPKLGLGEFLDFFIGSRFLATELVAGKREDAETRLVIFFVQGTQTCVLGSEASFTRDVDHEADLPLVAGKGNVLAVNGGHLEIVHVGHIVLLDWFLEI